MLGSARSRANRGRLPEPRWLQIFEQALAAALAAKATLAIAAKTAGRVEQISAVDPDNARLQLCRDVQRNVDAFAPHAGGRAVHRVVRQLDGLARRSKRHRRKHGAKNFLLGND